MSISKKLQTGTLATITVLTVSIMLLNLLGGIVSGIWLAILGQWGAIFKGIIAMIISVFVLSFILMPGLLFSGPAVMLLEKGKKVAGMFFGFLGLSYTVAVLVGWCMWVLLIFMDMADQRSFIPMLIWSYGVALVPWFWMAEKERATNEFSSFFILVASIAYIVAMIMVVFGATFGAVAITFGFIMFLTAVLQVVIAFGGEIEKSFTSKKVKEAFSVLDEIEETIGGPSFSLVREPIEKYLLSYPTEYEESAKKTSPREQIYSMVANIAGDLVGSGQYHLYRGVINPMGPGGDLLKLFESALDELFRMGAIEEDRVKEEKMALQENIKTVG